MPRLFKMLIQLVLIFLIKKIFLGHAVGMWDPAEDQILTPCTGSVETTTGPPQKSQLVLFLKIKWKEKKGASPS